MPADSRVQGTPPNTTPDRIWIKNTETQKHTVHTHHAIIFYQIKIPLQNMESNSGPLDQKAKTLPSSILIKLIISNEVISATLK